MQHYRPEDTIVALATPPGIGAIGVIRLSGPKVFDLLPRVWKGIPLSDQPGHTAHFGKIIENGRPLDEVLLTIFRNPRSYTGEDLAEISCHGSPFILDQVMQALVRAGARPASPGEFTLRAFLNGKLDLAQAEAVADLIAADSEGALKAAMYQMRGGFSKEISRLREQLIHFASLVELELDFSEEDVEFADRGQLKSLMEEIRTVAGKLMASFRFGNVLKNGYATVIAGKPNAGKSTLLNALLNEERAIVSDTAGTTRDTVEEAIQLGGVSFRFIDTAGIRHDADSEIERIGINKALEKMETAAVVIYLFDASQTTPEELEKELSSFDRSRGIWLLAANKWDRCSGEQKKQWESRAIIPVSAGQKEIAALTDRLVQLATETNLGAGDAAVSNVRHLHALQETDQAIAQAIKGIDLGLTGDLLAEDIRQALYHLGEITGEITTDDLLENIFTRFCIGK